MARIDRDLLREGIGIFALLFRKRKISRILRGIVEAIDYYDNIRDIDNRLDVAIASKEGITLTFEEAVALRRIKDKLKNLV